MRRTQEQVLALEGLDLHVAAGEFVSLVGPSGCGKTTLLNAIAGLQQVNHGAIYLDGSLVTSPGRNRVPTPEDVVEAMLTVAKVTENDVVYDLGCGDGRIVVTAAKKHGARGVGIDIDPQRIREARENVRQAGVADKVTILEADLFTADIGRATVVTLYLLPSLNKKLMPKLTAELKPGTRIVSHAFDMGDWAPEQELEVTGRHVYYWTIPKRQ